MKEPDIRRLKDHLYAREDVIVAYIFGSYASESPTPLSDIDVAVLLSGSSTAKEHGLIKLDIINSLIELLCFDKIDLVVLNVATPLLAHEIIKKGMLLFSKDEMATAEYRAKATRQYLDTIYLRRIQDRILHEKIRSGDFGHFKGSHKRSIEKVRKGASDPSAVK